MSKNAGKIFEEDFADSFPDTVFIYRLRDTSSSWQGAGNGKSRFTVKNICDFIAYSNISNTLLLLELKSFQGKSCPFSNLKPHQVKSLYIEGQKDGVKAYFILNFRDLEETYAIDAELIYQFWEKAERKSFSIDWCRENGTLIEQEIKVTHFKYKVDKLLN